MNLHARIIFLKKELITELGGEWTKEEGEGWGSKI